MIIHPRQVRRGAAAVEFAFIAIILFMVVFGIFEYGRYLMVVQVCNNAAREGARYAVVNTATAGVTTASIQTYVDGYLAGLGGQLVGYTPASNILVYMADPATGANTGAWNNAAYGTPIAVEITGTYKPIVPTFLFMNANITVDAKAVMYSEAN